jgi:hypothetical protein
MPGIEAGGPTVTPGGQTTRPLVTPLSAASLTSTMPRAAPCAAPTTSVAPHASTRATRGPGVHDFARASRGSDVPALLTSPSGYVGATGTASTSAITVGEGRTSGTSGQPSSDDHTGETGISAIGQQTHTTGHLVIVALSDAHLRPCHPRRPVLASCNGGRI